MTSIPLLLFFAGMSLAQVPPPSDAQMDAAEAYSVEKGGQTFLVIHQGNVIRESYANGGMAGKFQLLGSGTKGFIGMIGAIAAHEGLIDLDDPVVEVLKEWENDTQKSMITYRHLLTMASGLEELKDQKAWTDFLQAKVLYPAGTTFIYGPDPNLFGLALQRKLGAKKLEDYMEEQLFSPLGIEVDWRGRFADGNPQLSGGAFVKANEWHKFGEFVRLMLKDEWTGPELLPKEYLEQVIGGSEVYPAYGFYWWLKETVPDPVGDKVDLLNNNVHSLQIKPILDEPSVPDDFIMCRGAYGQCLYVIPSRELVVVRNAPSMAKQVFKDNVFLALLLTEESTAVGDPAPPARTGAIHPNPVSSMAFFPAPTTGEYLYAIYDSRGVCVQKGCMEQGMIRMQDLASGPYLVHVIDTSGRTMASQMMIKQ